MADATAKSFDFWVHHRDKKTGKVGRTNPYSMEVTKDGTFIRRGGKCFAPNGDEVADPRGSNFRPGVKSEQVVVGGVEYASAQAAFDALALLQAGAKVEAKVAQPEPAQAHRASPAEQRVQARPV